MKSFSIIPEERIARLNRRQRKKLHVGEFQEFGFHFGVVFCEPLDESACDAWLDEVIERVESLGLVVGGLGGSASVTKTEAFVAFPGRGSSVSPAQRDALLALLRDHLDVARVDASDLVDAWHGWDEA